MWSESKKRCGRGGKKMWEGVDLLGLRQTDSRQAVQSCADPSLQRRAQVRPLPWLLSLSPATCFCRNNTASGKWKVSWATGELLCLPPSGLSATCASPAGAAALRTWRRGVCCRYQPRSAQPARCRCPGLPPSDEPLAWMHYGHVCLQGSVFRRHRSI